MKSRILLTCLVALMSMASGVCLAGSHPAPKQSAAPERLYSAMELRSDFEQMYRELKAAHFDLYAFTPKPELDRLYARTLAGLSRPLTLPQAKNQFELFAAAVHMGHTRVDSPASDWARYRKHGGRAFPLQIRIADGRVYVAENLSGLDTIRQGDEITSLDGESLSRWLERTERHVSAETPYMAHSLMEYDFPTYVWVELGAVDGFDIVLSRVGSASQRLHIPARTSAEMDAARKQQPPVLDLEKPLRDSRMLSDSVAYLRPGPFYNAEAKTGAEEWDVSSFHQFIDSAFESFSEAHAASVIIDLRGNPGGDNLFSDVLVSWIATRPFRFASQFKIKVSEESTAANQARIANDAAAAGPISQKYANLYAHASSGDIVDFDIPLAYPRPGKRFNGKVFVLIDRQSYSDAVSVAALVQDYKFGVILGEPTSDMATTYGAMEQFTLKNTKLLVGYPKARIVRPNGDLREKRGVTPDIQIRIPIVQSVNDEVLRQAEIIAQHN